MSTVQDIYESIDAIAPFSSAMGFDNVGILVGDGSTQVTRVLMALDITPAVVEEAVSINANCILSHHPVIFHPLKALSAQSVPYLLAKHGIAALCCHTNLDASPVCGTNAALGALLGLKNVHPVPNCGDEVVLFTGELPQPLSPEAFAGLVKEKLSLPALPYVPGDRDVNTVCFCTGAGGDFLSIAAQRHADAYLTGELHHHEAIEAAQTGMTVLAAGHYETEKPFAPFLAAYLKKRCPDTAFLLSKAEQPPLRVV